MNRITAILLAMVALLVHVLVIHRDLDGAFAYAYESAHVAFRLGIHWVENGSVSWSVDPATGQAEGGLWSYPSPLLVWLAGLFEALSLNVDRAAQVVGILCVLTTVFLTTRFDTDRIAGVIPALLLVSSGATAAAGASGTEWPIAMFAFAVSFVALEHGRTRFASLGLVLLVLSRPEGLIIAVVLCAQTLLRIYGPRSVIRVRSREPRMIAFVLPALAVLVAQWAGSSMLSDTVKIFRPTSADNAVHGLHQLRDFFVGTITPILLAFPLYCTLRGNLTGVGRRALFATVAWCAAAVGYGGGPAAFDIAFAPVLPIMFIAIQQGMARVLDTYLKSMERLVWISLSIAIFGSLLGSRFPGNLGQIELRGFQERLLTAKASVPLGRSTLVGRTSLFSEIQLTNNLRRVGSFLQTRLPETATVMTPWPGVLGAMMDGRIVDAFGRTTVLPGMERQQWSPEPGRFDAQAALAIEPDYIVPAIGSLGAFLSGELDDFLPDSLFALDPNDGETLRAQAREMLAHYEIVVTTGGAIRSAGVMKPLLLLRRRGLESPVSLTATRTASIVRIVAGFSALNKGTQSDETRSSRGSLPQVFDVEVVAIYADGARIVLDPNGRPMDGRQALGSERDPTQLRTLVGIVIDPLWTTQVTVAEVATGALDREGSQPVRIEARLLHHRFDRADERANATLPAAVDLK